MPLRNSFFRRAWLVSALAATAAVLHAAPAAAQVSGHVTRAATGAPVAGVSVSIYSSTGSMVATTSSDAWGVYSFTGLPASSYFVRAEPSSAFGLEAQLFNSIVCAAHPSSAQCTITSGTPVIVTGSQAVAGIHFSLLALGTITGTVTDGTGAPVAGVTIYFGPLYSDHVSFSAVTNAQGAYQSPGLISSSYSVYATPPVGSGLTEQPYSGGLRQVQAGQATAHTDFVLALGARITGTVRSAATSAPLANVQVTFHRAGLTYGPSLTDAQGVYVSPGLLAGSYRVVASATPVSGLVGQLYDHVACPWGKCSLPSGTAIDLTASGADNIDFDLAAGGAITGTVINAATLAPAPGVDVALYSSNGGSITSITTNAQGVFAFPGLSTGSYFVAALPSRASGLVWQVYSNIACPSSCPITSGTPVVVTAPNSTSIQFALTALGAISGTVTDANGAPVADASVDAERTTGEGFGTARTDAEGRYVLNGLNTGDYFVRVFPPNGSSLLGEIYDNIPCPIPFCPVTSGTPVAVTAPAVTPNINVVLSLGGTISGRVTNAMTLAPIVGASVFIHSSNGTRVDTVDTDAFGNYSTLGLPTGSYFVVATSTGLLAQVYSGISCAHSATCPETSGTPVVVTAPSQTSGINLALSPSASITGTVTSLLSGGAVNATVSVYSSTGDFLKSTTTNAQGAYTVNGLLPGSYRVRALPSNPAYIGQLYKDISCPGGDCVVTSGTPVLANAATATAANFKLVSFGKITGTITHAVTHAPVAGVAVFLHTSIGSYVAFAITDAQGAYSFGGLTSGSYLVLASPSPGSALFSEVYDDVPCAFAGCTITSGTPVPVSPPGTTANINIELAPAVTITGLVTAAATGSPVPNALVRIYTSDGTYLGTSETNHLGMYTAVALQGGTYFLVAEPLASTRLVPQLYEGLSCPPGSCVVTSGTPVVAVVGNVTTANFALTMAPFGQVDTPRPFVENDQYVMGAFAMTGWALDDVGVTKVQIFRNCLGFEPANCQTVDGESVVYIGDAAFLEGARPDVAAAFPTMPNNTRAGWGYLLLTPMLPQVLFDQPYGGYGPLTLFAFATDGNGNRRLLGRSSDPASADYTKPTHIFMAQLLNAKPFGLIDTPGQGETVSGILQNFGWAITPDTNAVAGDPGDIVIPTDGSTMTVFIDGVPTAYVAYNQCRGTVGNPPPPGVFCDDDVSNIFGTPAPMPSLTPRTGNPTRYRNLDAGRGAIGAFTIDTTTLSNGVHTIAWSVTDSAGRIEGTGSRFFIVDNPVPARSAKNQGTLDEKRPTTFGLTGAASAQLAAAVPVKKGLSVRSGFDLAEPWKPLKANEDGQYLVRLPQLGRVELWLGEPVDDGYLLVNETLQPLPLGTSLKGSAFAWMPPAGYLGPYQLVFRRGGERIDVSVIVR